MIQPKNKRGPGNPNWGGAREESQLIRKYSDKWCRDHGYPIQRRKWVNKGRPKSVQNVSKKRQATNSV